MIKAILLTISTIAQTVILLGFMMLSISIGLNPLGGVLLAAICLVSIYTCDHMRLRNLLKDGAK